MQLTKFDIITSCKIEQRDHIKKYTLHKIQREIVEQKMIKYF